MKYHIATLLFLCLAAGFLTSTAQTRTNIPDKVVVLPINIQVPTNAKKLVTIKLGNNNTQVHCAYDDLVTQAKQKAASLGGNIVKITELISPYFIGTCYKIRADIYYADPLPKYDIKEEPKTSVVSKLGDTAQYALLYVYRLADTITFQPGYDLYMDDSAICRVKSRSRSAIKICKEGKTTFAAETESKKSIVIDIKLRQVYFLRCGTVMGSIRQVPYMEQVPNDIGLAQYEELTKTRKDLNISYLNQVH